MIRLKFSALFLGLIFPYVLIGQFSDFDLSKYKLPDIKTNRLDLNFNLNNYSSKSYSEVPNLDNSEAKQSNFTGTLDLYYYGFRNTEKYQGDLAVSANLSPQHDKDTYNELVTKRNTLNTDFRIRSKNAFFNQNMSFIELDPLLSYFFSNDRNYRDMTTVSSRISNTAQYTTNISLPVSVGHGRIEPVEDARLAVYIIEELFKAGKISGLPSENVILEMAREISKIKRKRFFDSRIRKIEELQAIDSFLVANDIISSNDINYFSVLNDQWDYAYGPSRESGFAISAGFDNNIRLSKFYQETILDNANPVRNNYKEDGFRYGGFLKLRYARPINLYWQTAGSVSTSYNVEQTGDPEKEDSEVDNYSTKTFRTDLNYSLQFLPDSRTSIKLNITGSYVNLLEDRTISYINPYDYKLKSNQLTLAPAIDVYYYISPQFRIELSSSLNLNNSISSDKTGTAPLYEAHILNRSQNNILVHLTYSFF